MGWISVECTEDAVVRISFVDQSPQQHPSDLTEETVNQLKAYFDGSLHDFNLPLEPDGSPFQLSIWRMLQEIPFGTTTSYGKLAEQAGDPNLSRAIGLANGKNPIAVVIPCHRVIGADGSLTGYAGGLWRKEYLLKHEGAIRQMELF
ncbi:MAG: methylated-DNA--[protein]-cysteine S-methyltransferase [Flavobacteriales bacterium]|nr:methylated-DNA--[protein]-cysteine S-methyltransferase [Flavobacteriales bacterium]